MIIVCPCGEKKFEVNENLIPEKGRTLQCGACDKKWFFNKNDLIQKEITSEDVEKKKSPKRLKRTVPENSKAELFNEKNIEPIKNSNENYQLTKYETKSIFSFSKALSYILVLIISFIALIIVLDTFKTPLYGIFPKLEYILFSFYELLIDIKLFINDLLL